MRGQKLGNDSAISELTKHVACTMMHQNVTIATMAATIGASANWKHKWHGCGADVNTQVGLVEVIRAKDDDRPVGPAPPTPSRPTGGRPGHL